jgi:predicted membrane-bound mannosyltransferase
MTMNTDDAASQLKSMSPELADAIEVLLDKIELLEANQKAIQGHVEGMYGVVDALRERAERAEREREVMLKSMVEYDPTYPKAPWVVNKPWGYRLPYRWYLTEAEARAAAFRALGVDTVPAGDKGGGE